MSGPTPDPPLFRALFESTPAASIAVVADAPDLTVFAVTDGYLALFGGTRASITGQPLTDTSPYCELPQTSSLRLRQSLAEIPDAPSVSSASGHSVAFGIGDHTWTIAPTSIPASNGAPALLLLTLSQSKAVETGTPLNDPARTPDARFVKVEHINGHTNRPLPEETRAIALSSHDVFHAAAPGFAVFDLHGSLLDCNPAFARMLGRTREELQRLPALQLVHAEDRSRSSRDIQRLVAGEAPAVVAVNRCVRPDGSIATLRQSVSLVRSPSGDAQKIVMIAEDLTLFRTLEKTLIKTEKEASIGRLSGSIVHELNNPLEAVTNLLFLMGHTSEIDEIRSYARLAEEELSRVTQIVTHTLRFYRHEAAPAAVQVADVLDSVLALFEGRLRRRNIDVVKQYRQTPGPLHAYGGELRQVFVNLVSNALDAMGETGRLRIDVRPSRNWKDPENAGVRITVCDTGSGIPRHMLQTIFDPLVSTKETNGTGLGLWISKEIVQRHGGTLRVRSTVTGHRRGTAMSVFLPSGRIAVAA